MLCCYARGAAEDMRARLDIMPYHCRHALLQRERMSWQNIIDAATARWMRRYAAACRFASPPLIRWYYFSLVIFRADVCHYFSRRYDAAVIYVTPPLPPLIFFIFIPLYLPLFFDVSKQRSRDSLAACFATLIAATFESLLHARLTPALIVRAHDRLFDYAIAALSAC